MSAGGPSPFSSRPALRQFVSGHGLALVGLPLLTRGSDAAASAVVTIAAAVVVGALCATGVLRLAPRARVGPVGALLGALLDAVGTVLMAVTPRGAIDVVVALVVGTGVGALLP